MSKIGGAANLFPGMKKRLEEIRAGSARVTGIKAPGAPSPNDPGAGAGGGGGNSGVIDGLPRRRKKGGVGSVKTPLSPR